MCTAAANQPPVIPSTHTTGFWLLFFCHVSSFLLEGFGKVLNRHFRTSELMVEYCFNNTSALLVDYFARMHACVCVNCWRISTFLAAYCHMGPYICCALSSNGCRMTLCDLPHLSHCVCWRFPDIHPDRVLVQPPVPDTLPSYPQHCLNAATITMYVENPVIHTVNFADLFFS